jgi:hypothetical protein
LPRLKRDRLFRGSNQYYGSHALDIFKRYLNPTNSPQTIDKLAVAFDGKTPIAWAMKVSIGRNGRTTLKKTSRKEVWRYTKSEYRKRGLSKKLGSMVDKRWFEIIP